MNYKDDNIALASKGLIDYFEENNFHEVEVTENKVLYQKTLYKPLKIGYYTRMRGTIRCTINYSGRMTVGISMGYGYTSATYNTSVNKFLQILDKNDLYYDL